MRFMILVKANPASESGQMPTEQELTEMGRFNEELVKAGVLLAGEGLHPSSRGARVRFSGSERTVVEGPFGATSELLAGFWLLQLKSRDEAVEWVKRIPFHEGEVEIRQVFEADDFAESDPSGELRAAERRLREQAAAGA
ncbi:YciI family protein [Longimicrobium sp.]|uniref:YciI family protein n=1 Tax=Longimicrobium sp. TaxID=2029185 RepID=UPI002E342637|nr:YciI family protein [Longimicrobium sp.]HEX6038991.1 YciI family protein [Longimicrobium sp.]